MQILLDTFAFIWLASEPLKLSSKAKEVLSDENNEFFPE
jgi:PIN domain nuclease of toxin-antitoxin system